MDYQKKYLKYKNKYLSLKQKGGNMTYETAPLIKTQCEFSLSFFLDDHKLFYDVNNPLYANIEGETITYFKKYADKASYLRSIPYYKLTQMLKKNTPDSAEIRKLVEEEKIRFEPRRNHLLMTSSLDEIITWEEMLALKSDGHIDIEENRDPWFSYGHFEWKWKRNADGSIVYVPGKPSFRFRLMNMY
jgi:hypothetical protein